MAASRWELSDQAHRESVNGGDSICGVRNTGSSQARPYGRNAGVRMCQDEDGFALPMRDERLGNQLRFSTTCGGRYGATLDSEKINLRGHL